MQFCSVGLFPIETIILYKLFTSAVTGISDNKTLSTTHLNNLSFFANDKFKYDNNNNNSINNGSVASYRSLTNHLSVPTAGESLVCGGSSVANCCVCV